MLHYDAVLSRALLALSLTFPLACDSGSNGAPKPAPSASERAPAQAGPAYALEVDEWEGPVGEEGYVVVAVAAQSDHKINAKYPQRVDLDAPPKGLDLPLRKLTMAEANLENDKRLVFTVPVVPAEAGTYALKGTVKLSVCNDSQCKTVEEKLQARVTAQ